MNNKLFETVNELLEKYIGGQIFFTELDKAVKFDKQMLIELVNAVDRKYCLDTIFTIASGEMALALHNFDVDVDFIVPGGLRNDPSKINLEPWANIVRESNFVFMDDSYFSGRTALVIQNEIERLGGKFLGSYVIYDGSKIKEDNVDSLYRYYDNYDVLGQLIV